MAPDSVGLIVVLLLIIGGLFVLMAKLKHLAVRIAAAVIVVAVSAVTGMAIVNDYYGYYRSWSQLSTDLSGSYTPFTTTAASSTVVRRDAATGHGVIESITFPGAQSHITRPGLVYLPPQYFQPQYAHTSFPVVELLHGSPGHPIAWIVQLSIAKVMDELIAKHEIGPMILVLPTMNNGDTFEDGVNAPGALDDTYLVNDVRTDVLAKLRASNVPSEWGVAGYSSGGYAAANLGLRHRDQFGAVGIMDGYFRPQDGPAADALHHDAAAEAANNPLLAAAGLSSGVAPLPAFWVSVGTGDAGDYAGAKAFIHALHGVESVPFFTESGAGHNFYDWSASVPHLMTWMWSQLAPPQLRVQFPLAGAPRDGALIAPPLPPGGLPTHSRSHAPSAPSGATSAASGSAVAQMPYRRHQLFPGIQPSTDPRPTPGPIA